MRGVVIAALGLVLAGCAPAVTSHAVAPASPVSRWDDGAESLPLQVDAAALAAAAAALSAVEQQQQLPSEPGAFEPEMVHAARLEMAREALVEDNLGKERMDVAEELERELEALQNTEQTGKSRGSHGATRKKHP